MFFIINKTKRNIIISDIKVSLGPRQAIDLDKMIDRDISDKSKDLKNIREKYWGHIIQECVFCGKRKIKAKNFKWEKSNEIHTTTILVPYLK